LAAHGGATSTGRCRLGRTRDRNFRGDPARLARRIAHLSHPVLRPARDAAFATVARLAFGFDLPAASHSFGGTVRRRRILLEDVYAGRARTVGPGRGAERLRLEDRRMQIGTDPDELSGRSTVNRCLSNVGWIAWATSSRGPCFSVSGGQRR